MSELKKATTETMWTTHDELKFINGMGKFTTRATSGENEIIEKLYKYREAAEGRAYWGRINKYDVLQAVDERIKSLQSNVVQIPKKVLSKKSSEVFG